jgi:hypothetical protein
MYPSSGGRNEASSWGFYWVTEHGLDRQMFGRGERRSTFLVKPEGRCHGINDEYEEEEEEEEESEARETGGCSTSRRPQQQQVSIEGYYHHDHKRSRGEEAAVAATTSSSRPMDCCRAAALALFSVDKNNIAAAVAVPPVRHHRQIRGRGKRRRAPQPPISTDGDHESSGFSRSRCADARTTRPPPAVAMALHAPLHGLNPRSHSSILRK